MSRNHPELHHNSSKAKKALKKLVNPQTQSPRESYVGPKWVNASVKDGNMSMRSSLNQSLTRKLNRKFKKGSKTTKNKNKTLDNRNNSLMTDAFGDKSMMSASLPRQPRQRGSYLDSTQAQKDREAARLAEIKETGPRPMRYTNQGHADKHDDGSRPPLDSELAELES